MITPRPGRPTKRLPDTSILRERFTYDPETGLFIFLPRDGIAKHHNVRRAGKRAGYWHSDGYRYINIDGSAYSEHRLAWAMMGFEECSEIDHINGVKDDNRICNLRKADRLKSAQNRSLNSNNTSGFPGVSFSQGRYQARIGFGRKRIYIGRFKTAADAYSAYLGAKKEIHSFNPGQRL